MDSWSVVTKKHEKSKSEVIVNNNSKVYFCLKYLFVEYHHTMNWNQSPVHAMPCHDFVINCCKRITKRVIRQKIRVGKNWEKHQKYCFFFTWVLDPRDRVTWMTHLWIQPKIRALGVCTIFMNFPQRVLELSRRQTGGHNNLVKGSHPVIKIKIYQILIGVRSQRWSIISTKASFRTNPIRKEAEVDLGSVWNEKDHLDGNQEEKKFTKSIQLQFTFYYSRCLICMEREKEDKTFQP